MSEEDKLFELRAIKKTLAIAHADKLDDYLNTIIKRERKKMWVYIDGKNDTKTIAEKSKVTTRAVTIFLNYAVEIGIVEWEPRGNPKRVIDHIPADWLKDIDEEQDGPKTE